MPTLPGIALVFLAALALAPLAAAQQSVQQLLTEAQTAYMRGDLETAKRHFQAVNRADPRNQVAIGFLRRIAADQANTPKGNSMEKQLGTLVIPQVNFNQATLGAALDYLRQTVAKVSDGKSSVNFVVQVPEEQARSQTVTLTLSNVPFTEVLRYLGSVASVDFVYDKYAIIVRPRGGTAAAGAGVPAPAQ
jgi:hypothetical protein